ncbi:MAG: HD domain-containing protein [Candidatus Aminicenantes bacterium]|nr:HD domain-containing protein [Candidatus Aminicenantes bacterium]
MKEDVLDLIPEIGSIADVGLRDLVLTVWVEAVRRGGWTPADLREMPFTLLLKKTPVNLIDHTRAVTRTAREIGQVLDAAYGGRVKVDADVLLAGAILHDVGKLFEYSRDKDGFKKSREGDLLRHPISGAAFAFKHGLPQEVVHIIAAHSKEGDGTRRTVEAVIVNHADFVNFDIFHE